MKVFKCKKCGKPLNGFPPTGCICGFNTPIIDGIYQFTDDVPISLDDNGLKYLGYENIGENFEPAIVFGEITGDDYGLYGACSRKLVEVLGKGCVVLDLGAGLGTASIPLAMAGAKTIAADISQKMLSTAVKRSFGKNLDENLICARMNAYDLEITDSSVDVVVELAMLHQVDKPELVFHEILRVLKPDGILVHYGCTGLVITDEQREINKKCSEALSDIQKYYQVTLTELGYTGLPFESWSKVNDCLNEYFEQSYAIQTDFMQVWTGKMKYGIHKLQKRASGGAQLIPDEIHKVAWDKTNEYAINKYGEDYKNIPGYSKYTGPLEIYKIKSK